MECRPVLRTVEMVHAAERGKVWIWRECGVVGCQCCSVEVVQNALIRGSILYEYRINVVVDPQSMVGWRSAQNGTFTLRVQGVP